MTAFIMTVAMGFLMYFRNRSAVFWGIAFPIIFMGLIGLAFGRGVDMTFTVAFVDQGGSPLAQGLRQGLEKVPVFQIVSETDEAAAIQSLRKGRYTLVVVPPPASGGVIRVLFDQARVQESQTAMMILERFVAESNLKMAGVQPALRLESKSIAGARRLRFFDFLLPGILAMTVMQTGLMGVSWVVTDYRQRLILKRVLATPVHPFVFLSGLVSRYVLVNLAQLAIIVVFAIFAFKATIVGNLTVLAGLAVLGTFVFVGMGFAISTLSKTPESANLLGSVINFPMMFLSGTFWPRELMPDFLQPLIGLLPLTPLVEAMRAVAARGEVLTSYLPSLAYLAAWGGVAFGVAAWRFRWE